METNLDILKQDIIFLIKRSLENSFYSESIDLCQLINIKIPRETLVDNYSYHDIKQALKYLGSNFTTMVKSINEPDTIHMLSLMDSITFTDSSIDFITYQFYINKLNKVDFDLKNFKNL